MKNIELIIKEKEDRKEKGKMEWKKKVREELNNRKKKSMEGCGKEESLVNGIKREWKKSGEIEKVIVNIEEKLWSIEENKRIIGEKGMRIGMIEKKKREKFIGRDKMLDEEIVGVKIIEVIVNEKGWKELEVGEEERRIIGIKEVIEERERDIRINEERLKLEGIINKWLKVLKEMDWRSVKEKSKGIVGEMIEVENRKKELVEEEEEIKRVIEEDIEKLLWWKNEKKIEMEIGIGEKLLKKIIGEEKNLKGERKEIILGLSDIKKEVIDERRIGKGEIERNGKGSSGKDEEGDEGKIILSRELKGKGEF